MKLMDLQRQLWDPLGEKETAVTAHDGDCKHKTDHECDEYE